MSDRTPIQTDQAPAAIGTYSQAVQVGGLVFLSGQIALRPDSMALEQSSVEAEVRQVFANLQAVAEAAGGSLQSAVKLTLYLTDLNHFATVNEVMESLFQAPSPARAAVGVASLPKGARVEADAILSL